ncbi:FolC bifunctional protein [Rhizopus microsporus var. microsporus]|uniref:Dihydrofolate synthetase n=1 Tax=Rhizopus microsporus var. microsporus TaxID=86635 RepID=A0A1X0QTF9_RHIZD|nr:FolC bifunctional protein [Rhizopus microsporus var. microsporus]
MDFGLERTRRLLDALDKPDERIKIVHVAGTNGKGSVCAYVASVLRTCGYSVGRFNSPHLIEPRDSINVNGQAISQIDYNHAVEAIDRLDKNEKIGATSFERLVATAFYLFDQHHVEFVVLEVGLGGRYDATNAIGRPTMCIITAIGMDHANILGNAIEEIAYAKAGIMKPGCPVVIAPQDDSVALDTLEDYARQVQCPYKLAMAAEWIGSQMCSLSVDKQEYTYTIQLNGDYQRMNSGTAVTALDWLHQLGVIQLTVDQLAAGMAKALWPGRLDWITSARAPKLKMFHLDNILVDGAHNPPAAAALHRHVESLRKKRVIWIIGATTGKNIKDMLHQLVKPEDALLAVPFSQPEGMPWIQSIDPSEIANHVKGASSWCSLEQALKEAGTLRQPKDIVVLCGSLYLVADFYRLCESNLI